MHKVFLLILAISIYQDASNNNKSIIHVKNNSVDYYIPVDNKEFETINDEVLNAKIERIIFLSPKEWRRDGSGK